MFLRELLQTDLEERQVWGRTGTKIVRKYRCAGGRRNGRVVSKLSQCFAPLNIKQSVKFKQTKNRLGARMARKSKRTKRINPASKRLKALNRKR
jgi:hypothetical protein|tara:strand:- start:489 stop:770 length:282 start_codon:yes stop_codon:yes gene_type:complete